MVEYPHPHNEKDRLKALDELDILDTPPSPGLDTITALASELLHTPVAFISLLDDRRQWFKSITGIKARETPRNQAFCNYTILDDDVLLVPHASDDPRFAHNPFVVDEPRLEAYAGVPLSLTPGLNVGSLCVMDRRPRHFSDQEITILKGLGQLAADQLRLHLARNRLATELRRQQDLVQQLTERDAELQRQHVMFRQTERMARMAGWELELETGCIRWSDEGPSVTGLSRRDLSHFDQMLGLCSPEGRDRLMEAYRLALSQGRSFDTEISLHLRQEQSMWVRVVGEVEAGYQQSEQRLIGMFQDITERKQLEQKLWTAATRDALTGAFNRSAFQDHLQQAVTSSLRGEDRTALLLLDLDHFKEINDRYGHSAGDAMLKAVTQRVLGCIRTQDSLARIGGDEFAVIMTRTRGPEDVKAAADRILKALEEPVVHDRSTFYARGSIGAALSPTDGETPEALLRSADIALYHAKESGRATFSLFAPAMRQASDAQARAIQEFRRALRQDEIVPYYQPELDLKTGRIIGIEALARWVHGTDGVRGPADFSAALEDPATCRLLGMTMIEKVVGDLARWNAAEVPVGIVAVNVTGVELRQHDFPDHVLGVLERRGAPVEQFKLEVTETTFLDRSSEQILRNLRELRELGVKIALDDFGTGFASLSHLLTLPVDVLKIDRSFVGRAMKDSRAAAIAEAIITLGQSLELLVVAEGVETDKQAAWLRRCGCDVAQGYWVAPPMPYEEVSHFLQAFGSSAPRWKPV